MRVALFCLSDRAVKRTPFNGGLGLENLAWAKAPHLFFEVFSHAPPIPAGFMEKIFIQRVRSTADYKEAMGVWVCSVEC